MIVSPLSKVLGPAKLSKTYRENKESDQKPNRKNIENVKKPVGFGLFRRCWPTRRRPRGGGRTKRQKAPQGTIFTSKSQKESSGRPRRFRRGQEFRINEKNCKAHWKNNKNDRPAAPNLQKPCGFSIVSRVRGGPGRRNYRKPTGFLIVSPLSRVLGPAKLSKTYRKNNENDKKSKSKKVRNH